MLTGINGTIKINDDDKVVLEIAQNDLEKFKEYKHFVDSKEFYAEFTLGGKQLYVTGLYPQEEQNGDDIIMHINSVNSNCDINKIKELLNLNKKDRIEVQLSQLDTANTEKTVLQKQLDDLKDEQKKVSEEIDGLFTKELNGEIKGLIGSTDQDLKDKVKGLYDGKLKSTIEDIIGSNLSEMKDEDKEPLHKELQGKMKSIIGTDQSKNVDEIVESIKEELKNSIINASKFSKEVADLKVELEAKEKQIKTLEAEKNKAKAQITTLNTEVEKLKKELENKGSEIQKLGEKNKELEAKNKTTEQPKQGNGAKYTATVGMGLAAGLIAFTALERTVRLEMLVMIGIAVASALVAGSITYVALPSTQVDGAKAQEVNENRKKKSKALG